MTTLEEVMMKHEEKYPNIVELYSWSLNYEYPSPISYFLDLIGYSTEELGDTLGDWPKVTEKISLLELSYIADALQEYLKDAERAYEVIKELVDFGG
jgi:hypothetical protein